MTVRALTTISKAPECSLGLLASARDSGQDHVAQVRRCVKWMHVETVCDFSCNAAQRWIDSRGEDRDGMRLWGWGKEWRHQTERDVLAAEVQRCPAAPRVPDGTHRLDRGAQARSKRRPGHAKPPHDVGSDLRAQPQHEPPPRKGGEVPRK